jgi:hypothetical protein
VLVFLRSPHPPKTIWVVYGVETHQNKRKSTSRRAAARLREGEGGLEANAMVGNCVGARDETRDAVGIIKAIDPFVRLSTSRGGGAVAADGSGTARAASHTTMAAAGGGGGDDGGARAWLLACMGSHARATAAAAVAVSAAAPAAMRVHACMHAYGTHSCAEKVDGER